ncbi:hypothetical protein [Microbacterium cremeum]|uniref:hypothetical protein n=1 Tax=Microbacterium cremeum TaxID=2782169 RepID=UPI0018892085|nr:hypothetical protein [Microbacterium cremeum]
MSAVDYSAWVELIHQKAEQLRVVFLQLGSSNEPARRALTSSHLAVQTVRTYMKPDRERVEGTLLLDNMEDLAVTSPDVAMGALRERVFADVDAGTRVVLLSRAPRIAYPAVVGSSLLDDASFAHAPVVKSNGPEGFPACVEDGTDPTPLLRQALSELGPELCASLDRALYESMLTGETALSTLSARELEALDGAGITAPNGATRSWNFSKHLVPLKSALDDVLSDDLDPQHQLTDVSAGLWKIERIIRREIRKRAVTAWGGSWRQQCLNADLTEKVLERATEEAYLAATSIKHLRDPLEWLSLGELLQLKDRTEIGDLGLNAAFWRRFGAQIMPIRNRLAHMRTLRPDDATNVVKWQRVLELRLLKSGTSAVS